MRGRGNMRGSGADRGDRHYRSTNNYMNNRGPYNNRNDRYGGGGGGMGGSGAGGGGGGGSSLSNRYHSSSYNSGPSNSHYDSRNRDKLRSNSIGRHGDSSHKRHYRNSSRDHSRDRNDERKRSRHDDYQRTSSGGRGNRTPPPPPPPPTISSSGAYRNNTSYRGGARRDHRNDPSHARDRTPIKRTPTHRPNMVTKVRGNLINNRGFTNKTSFRGGANGRMRRNDPLELRRLRRLKAIKMSRLTSYMKKPPLKRRSKSPRRTNKKSEAGDEKGNKKKEQQKSDESGDDVDEDEEEEQDDQQDSFKKKRSTPKKARLSSAAKRPKSSEKSIKSENEDENDMDDNDNNAPLKTDNRKNTDTSEYNNKENNPGEDDDDDDDDDEDDENKTNDKNESLESDKKDDKKKEKAASQEEDSRPRNVRRPEDTRNKFIKLTCVHCHQRCVTFKEYSFHLNSRNHRNIIRQIAYRQKTQLLRLRASQRAAQREIEENCKENYESKFCHLCRLHYRQPKAKHQLSEHHKTIKKLLMPYCATCHLAFKSPMLYETHRCSIEHIRNKARHNDSDSAQSEVSDIGEIDLKKFTTVDSIGEIDEDMDLESLLVDSEIAEDLEKDKTAAENGGNSKPSSPLGAQFLSTVEAIFCKLCKEYYPFEDIDDFSKQHCRNRSHLKAYLRHKEQMRKGEGDKQQANGDANLQNEDSQENDNKDEGETASNSNKRKSGNAAEDEDFEEYENVLAKGTTSERKPETEKRGKLKNYDEERGLNEVVDEDDDQSSEENERKHEILLNDENSEDNIWGEVDID